MDKLVNISELCKLLNLIDSSTNKPLNHVLRFWEKKFTQIKPKKINNRRYYSKKDVEIITIIKILLKDHKVSINGVKNILNSRTKSLDDNNSNGLLDIYKKVFIRKKSKNIIEKINKIRNYGKKNSS